ncbi:MAG: universal stress protein [Caldilineaceae bacterium]|nr:universal stress protein [Caldilineaceae bacterium]MCB9140367.1 universal stress protein [Caldilineaceae bacterium]
MQTILVPMDGSVFCKQIFPHLQNLFPPTDNKLILLRVGDNADGMVGKPPRPVSPDMSVESYETQRDVRSAAHPIYASQAWESAVAELDMDMLDERQALEEMGYDVTVEIRLGRERGPAIVKYIDTHDIDAIAMTTHWRTGIPKLIFGSVAQYVAQHTSLPVLMVRPEE